MVITYYYICLFHYYLIITYYVINSHYYLLLTVELADDAGATGPAPRGCRQRHAGAAAPTESLTPSPPLMRLQGWPNTVFLFARSARMEPRAWPRARRAWRIRSAKLVRSGR